MKEKIKKKEVGSDSCLGKSIHITKKCKAVHPLDLEPGKRCGHSTSNCVGGRYEPSDCEAEPHSAPTGLVLHTRKPPQWAILQG